MDGITAPSWLARTRLLVGDQAVERLRRAHVLVVGLGGVGAYAAEMILRAGVGALTVADADRVEESNLNRQLIALRSTLGQPKAEVLTRRLLDIDPTARIRAVTRYIRDEQTDLLLDEGPYDYAVDAIDTLSPKAAFLAGCLARGIPVVSSMGSGARLDPTRIEVADLSATHHCPLAHMLRKRLHRMGIHTGIRAVFSPEAVREEAIVACEQTNKRSVCGTISYLPPAFGCACASVVVRDLLGLMPDSEKQPKPQDR